MNPNKAEQDLLCIHYKNGIYLFICLANSGISLGEAWDNRF